MATLGGVQWGDIPHQLENLGYRTRTEHKASCTLSLTAVPAVVKPRNETQGALASTFTSVHDTASMAWDNGTGSSHRGHRRTAVFTRARGGHPGARLVRHGDNVSGEAPADAPLHGAEDPKGGTVQACPVKAPLGELPEHGAP